MENTAIEKPISLVMKETSDGIVKILNDAHLPLCILAPIVKDIYTEIQNGVNVEYQNSLADYNKKIEEVNKNEKSTAVTE